MAYVDNIQFLINSGKVSSVKGMLAKFLKISPLLRMSPGKLPENIGKVKRGEIDKYFETVKSEVTNTKSYDIGLTHIKADDHVNKLIDLIKEHFSSSKIQFVETTGPVLGTNIGLKSIAISFLPFEDSISLG